MTTYDDAIAAAGEVIADDLVRQAERTPREAAVASLGRTATEDQIAAWIAAYRPARARSA